MDRWSNKTSDEEMPQVGIHIDDFNSDYTNNQEVPSLSTRSFPRLLITSYAGIGKSRPFLMNYDEDITIAVSTNKLKQSFVKNTKNRVVTHHNYADLNSKHGQKSRKTKVVVFDEIFMRSKSELLKIFDIQDEIICLGDPTQIEAHEGSGTIEFFKEHGFVHQHIHRTKDMKCRHSFEFGLELDTLACSDNKWAMIKKLFKPITKSQFSKDTIVLSGLHAQINEFNIYARDNLFSGKFPVRRVVKSETEPIGTITELDKSDSRIWWDRTGHADVAPLNEDGTTKYFYEPAFSMTVDCVQGETIRDKVIVLCHCNRQGVLYTGATRTVLKSNVYYYSN
jgi:hypothetical protein